MTSNKNSLQNVLFVRSVVEEHKMEIWRLTHHWSSHLLNSMKPSSMSQSSSQTVSNQILSWLVNYNFLVCFCITCDSWTHTERNKWNMTICRVIYFNVNMVLTSPSGFMKTFPNNYQEKTHNHWQLGNGIGNSRSSVQSNLLNNSGNVFQAITVWNNESCAVKKEILTVLPDLIRKA